MKAIDHILFPIDFKDIHQPLVDYAVQFVQKDADTQVTFLSIEKDSLTADEEQARNEQINAITAKYAESVKKNLSWMSKRGGVKDSILLAQKDLGADLIMMGTRGGDEPKDVTLASHLVIDATCPVLVIPESLEKIEIHKIALSVGNDVIADHKVLLTLFAVARLFNAQVHVLTVQSEDAKDKEAQRKNDDLLDYYLENLFARHSFALNSDIEQGIFDYVKAFNIDMLAIMPNNHTVKKGVKSEGRLTKVLTLHTEVPLLTLD